jgi:hypothetical protein
MTLDVATCHLVRAHCSVSLNDSAAVSRGTGLYRGVRANTEQTCLVRLPVLIRGWRRGECSTARLLSAILLSETTFGRDARSALSAVRGKRPSCARSFSYFDGYRPDGTPDAGLLFMAFQADPANGFIRIQQRLALADDLSRFVRHTSGALFAVPRGCDRGGYLGQDLMETL